MMNFIVSMLKIFGIVFLRFRPAPRIWGVWLVAVNLGALAFITHLEAQVVLATTTVAIVIQVFIYQKTGFTRVMGIAHILWVPMFAWIATRSAHIAEVPALETWLIVLAATNAVCAAIDTTDVIRFLRGERQPHYRWEAT